MPTPVKRLYTGDRKQNNEKKILLERMYETARGSIPLFRICIQTVLNQIRPNAIVYNIYICAYLWVRLHTFAC